MVPAEVVPRDELGQHRDIVSNAPVVSVDQTGEPLLPRRLVRPLNNQIQQSLPRPRLRFTRELVVDLRDADV